MCARVRLELPEGIPHKRTYCTFEAVRFLESMIVHYLVAVTPSRCASSVNMSLRCFFVLQDSITEEALIRSAQKIRYPKSVMFFTSVSLSRIVGEKHTLAMQTLEFRNGLVRCKYDRCRNAFSSSMRAVTFISSLP